MLNNYHDTNEKQFKTRINELSISDDDNNPLKIDRIACVDTFNHQVYFFSFPRTFIVYDYQANKLVTQFAIEDDVHIAKSCKFCEYITPIGNMYFCNTNEFYKYNINTKELKLINNDSDKHHDVLRYFNMDMLNHDEDVFFFGNKFKSYTSYLVKYNSREDTLINDYTFTDESDDNFNYEYPDPKFLTMWNDKVIAIGTTSFAYQAFGSGIIAKDVWVFSKNGHKRIKTRNYEHTFSYDFSAFATCYVPYGKDMAGIVFGGLDEDYNKVAQMGVLVLPLDKLDDLEELEWKIFDLPNEVMEKLDKCSFQMIENIRDKHYKFLIAQENRVYEFELIFDEDMIPVKSARNVALSRKNSSYSDVVFNF